MILSQGELIQSTTTSPDNGCYNGEVFLSYIDLNRYNTSNPYIDFDNVVVAMLDHITGRKLFTDYIHDLVSVWVNVCKAKDDPEKEVAAWKDLANEIHHRLHSDESLVFVVKKIFGDRLVPWIMSPPRAIFVGDSHVRNCIQRLVSSLLFLTTFYLTRFLYQFVLCTIVTICDTLWNTL